LGFMTIKAHSGSRMCFFKMLKIFSAQKRLLF
jgi:hypothetical protein